MDMKVEAYKFALPPGGLSVLQIHLEVLVTHELENERHWVLGGGVHSDKWHNIQALEAAASQCFCAEPLPTDFQLMGHTAGRHCLPRRPVSSPDKGRRVCKI
jgi:hypothetical protein